MYSQRAIHLYSEKPKDGVMSGHGAVIPSGVKVDVVRKSGTRRLIRAAFENRSWWGWVYADDIARTAKNPAWIPATAVRVVRKGRKHVLQIKTRGRAR
jgi:hypothetical protein